jgi:Pyruvate/2-oxoacid:ferredoxin oxidoreductase delta subunit
MLPRFPETGIPSKKIPEPKWTRRCRSYCVALVVDQEEDSRSEDQRKVLFRSACDGCGLSSSVPCDEPC